MDGLSMTATLLSEPSDSLSIGDRHMRDTLAVILAGGRGERLEPLTRDRAKPAVPFGGTYRIIDFTLSNCLNSGLRKMLLLTQFKSMSLDRHINLGWRRFFSRDLDEFIDVVPPQQRIYSHWYQGTADAVYQNIYTIEKEQSEYIVILAGDHVYKMDYCTMVDYHKQNNADLTVGALCVDRQAASSFGVMQVDAQQRVIGFQEKPQDPRTVPGSANVCLASMGIYVCKARFLFEQLLEDANRRDSSHDFGRDIIPSIIDSHRVFAFPFLQGRDDRQAYWRDVGTLDAYYAANMDLVAVEPELNLYDEHWPIRTYQRVLPPPKFVFSGLGGSGRKGHALDSIVCAGCIVSGGKVVGSVLGPCVRINSYSSVEESILFDDVHIGRHARVRRAIIEKGVRVPEWADVGIDLEKDLARGFTVSPGGVVVVPRVDNIEEMFSRVP
jgi:glucose-1-phosphate adenylyltransferase